MARWIFADIGGGETYTLDVNPNAGGSPTFAKAMTYASPSGPNANVVKFEGRDAPLNYAISGTVLTEAQYTAFNSWAAKKNQIKITDDLAREFWVRILGLTWTRAQTRQHLWRHTFSMQCEELDWA